MALPADDLLRLTHCPACGYRLDGLPGEGVCPECGRGYDRGEIVLYGTARGQYANVGTGSRGRAVADFVGSLGITAIGLYFGLVKSNPKWLPFAILFWAFCFWGFATAAWRRRTSNRPGLIQVRLSNNGVWQSSGPADTPPQPPWIAWDRIVGVETNSRPGDLCRIRIRRSAWTLAGASVLVDAEVRCTPDELAVLHRRIDEWRSAGA